MTTLTPQAALLDEGDRLARQLAQTLPGTLHDQTRLTFLGRSLALNLVNAFLPTLETISRRAGRPLHAQLALDHRQRPTVHAITADGEPLPALPADDLMHALLYQRGRLHPTITSELLDALTGDEHHATRALVRCLRSKPVLDGMQRQITTLLRAAPDAP